MRSEQAVLLRFVRVATSWTLDASRIRAPGRGAYLCSERCAQRVLKNKRYPGLGLAAQSSACFLAEAARSGLAAQSDAGFLADTGVGLSGERAVRGLCDDDAGVYDSRVP